MNILIVNGYAHTPDGSLPQDHKELSQPAHPKPAPKTSHRITHTHTLPLAVATHSVCTGYEYFI